VVPRARVANIISVTLTLLVTQGRELSVTKTGLYTEGLELSVTRLTRAPTVSGAEGEGGGGHHISAPLHLVESSHQHRQLIGWDVALRRNGGIEA
jgi:hypothetical protein